MAEIIIIGGGVSGLAAGIRAQMCGHSTVIYERHGRTGGNLTGWNRRGYHIDNCIHWLTGTNSSTTMYKTWEELGVLDNVDVYQPKTLYTFERDGKHLSLSCELKKLQNDMISLSPADSKEILSLIRAVKAFMHIEGISGDANDEKSTVFEKICAVPHLVRYYNMSSGELADKFKAPVICGFIESLLGRDFGALAIIMVFATFCGGNGGIPVGSSCAMADRMTERFIKLGGTVKLGCGVKKINISGHSAVSVVLDNGDSVSADYVLIASDPASAFGSMIDRKYMPHKLERQYGDSKLMRFSSWHCAFSCDTDQLPFESDIIFDVPAEYRDVIRADYMIFREFTHEKSFAPEGKSIIHSMTFVDEDDALKFIALADNKAEYRKKETELAMTVQKILTDKFGMLKGKLECIDVWTPATYKRYVGSEIGSYMSFLLPPKYIPRPLSPKISGLDNVFLATQWLRLPGGLPNAAAAGIDAVNSIHQRALKPVAVLPGKRMRAH